MYAFPVPTCPCLFIAHQKNYRIFFPFECKQHEEKLFFKHQRDCSQNDQFRQQAMEIWILACFIPLPIMRPAIKAEEKGQRGLAHILRWFKKKKQVGWKIVIGATRWWNQPFWSSVQGWCVHLDCNLGKMLDTSVLSMHRVTHVVFHL